mmetsp:Transcript_22975/g.39438  ORF Transcript_22975/g.39438 Transcript_22975/m.39438 type:complete len:275 (+) Transcript_22975:897-1721(+)
MAGLAVGVELDEAVVGAANVARGGLDALLQHVHEVLVFVLVREAGAEVGEGDAGHHLYVRGGEHAAAHGDQVRRERHDHVLVGGVADALLDLGSVAVAGDAVRVHAVLDLSEQQVLFGAATGAADAALGIDRDVVRVDEVALDQRQQRQLRARRVAPRIGDEPGGSDLVPGELDETIHGVLLQLRRLVLVAVPFGIGVDVLEPEIGGEVDNLDMRRQLGDDLLCRPVRQAAEHRVDVVEVGVSNRYQVGKFQCREVRKHGGKGLSSFAVRGENA